jgi:hypothetical protein
MCRAKQHQRRDAIWPTTAMSRSVGDTSQKSGVDAATFPSSCPMSSLAGIPEK